MLRLNTIVFFFFLIFRLQIVLFGGTKRCFPTHNGYLPHTSNLMCTTSDKKKVERKKEELYIYESHSVSHTLARVCRVEANSIWLRIALKRQRQR